MSSFRSLFDRFLPVRGGSLSEQNASSNAPNGDSKRAEIPILSKEQPLSNGSSSNALTTSRLRHLSPTALENSYAHSKRNTSLAPSNDTLDSTLVTRKRQLIEEQPGLPEFLSTGQSTKRWRTNITNTSLLEPSSRPTHVPPPRLDTTWSAGVCNPSPSLVGDSPASSVRSLRSRISRAPSTASALSSKTHAILAHIERLSTPAQDARRMPMLRVGMDQEKWAPLPSTPPNAPPLSRINSSIPSRAQLINSFTNSALKKPYWRDATRRRAPPAEEVAPGPSKDNSPVDNGPAVVVIPENRRDSTVNPLFDLSNGKNTNGQTTADKRKHEAALKNIDGSVLKGKNTFSARQLDEEAEEDHTEWMKNVVVPNFAAPKKGFVLEDATFTFAMPTVRAPTKIVEEQENEDEERDSEEVVEESDDSSVDEEDEQERSRQSKSSDTSSSVPASLNNDEFSRSVTRSPKPTAVEQTKEVPAPAAATDRTAWDCSECFVHNQATNDKCVCCGFEKYKSSAPSGAAPANVFGAKAFVAAPTSGVSFGFGVSAKPVAPSPASTSETALKLPAQVTTASETKPMFGLSKPSTGFSIPSSAPSTVPSVSTSASPFVSLPSGTTSLASLSTPSSTPSSVPSLPEVSSAPSFPSLPSLSGSSVPFSFAPSQPSSAPSVTNPGGPPTNLFSAITSSAAVLPPPPSSATSAAFSAPSMGLFGSSVNPPLFGSSSTASSSIFSSSTPAPNLISATPALGSTASVSSSASEGAAAWTASAPSVLKSGREDDGPASKRPFSFTAKPSNSTPFVFGQQPSNSSSVFGAGSMSDSSAAPSAPSIPSAPSFGSLSNAFGSTSTPQFGASAAPSEPPKTFNFGQPSTGGSTAIFQFGSAPPAAPAAPSGFGSSSNLFGSTASTGFPAATGFTGFNSAPAPSSLAPSFAAPAADSGNMFAFNPAGAQRKTAIARRRHPVVKR